MPRQQQLALPIGQVEVPEHLLRAVYEQERNWLKRGFEEVMQIPHFRICLKHLAIRKAAMGRKKR